MDVPGSPFSITAKITEFGSQFDYMTDLLSLGLAFYQVSKIKDPVVGSSVAVNTDFEVPIDTLNLFSMPLLLDAV